MRAPWGMDKGRVDGCRKRQKLARPSACDYGRARQRVAGIDELWTPTTQLRFVRRLSAGRSGIASALWFSAWLGSFAWRLRARLGLRPARFRLPRAALVIAATIARLAALAGRGIGLLDGRAAAVVAGLRPPVGTALITLIVALARIDGPWTVGAVTTVLTSGTPAPVHVRDRDRAATAKVGTAHASPPVVVDRALPLTGHEPIVPDAVPVLEDEAGLGAQGSSEDDTSAPVVAIGVVVGIVEHHDAEAHARVGVWIPIGEGCVVVTVIAQEPWVVVVLIHVVGSDVVIPVVVARRHDALGQIGERDIRVTTNAAVGDDAVIPVVATRDRIEIEGIGRSDRKDVSDPWIVVDFECVITVVATDLELPTGPDEAVIPRVPGEEHPHAAVGVHPEEGDVRVAISPQEDAGVLSGVVWIVATVSPDFHARAIGIGMSGGDDSRRLGTAAEGGEQHDGSEHMSSGPAQGHGMCRALRESKPLQRSMLSAQPLAPRTRTVLYHGHATVSTFREP